MIGKIKFWDRIVNVQDLHEESYKTLLKDKIRREQVEMHHEEEESTP